ncbi:hypothetical protein ATI61_102440 [Archangium gephyra]|uniref:Peptidase, M23/M37 family n=1 Tax=Archangium gephyra TaxID=48 RepID=A0AAC8QDC3_9BACT|nr:hypothetical protein [Archangium gephyra]AKJ05381.1 Peptidase, M23/M37 family [Archangium gephyra]REG36066.1 hypothetical protein ATI61_102440 [Archangium gephyra]
MRHMKKMTLAGLASLMLLSTSASAVTVKAPHPGTVTALTYSSSGAFHGAVDVTSGDVCNSWSVHAVLVGSYSWNITINTTGIYCGTGGGSSTQNEAKHVFADGWTLRLWHFIKTAASYDKTCDRCALGNEGGTGNVTGPHSHIQVDKSGTKDTSWYSGYVTKGEYVDRTTTIGVL